MKEHDVRAQYSRHARESGHPVRRAAPVDHQRFGILIIRRSLSSGGHSADPSADDDA